MNIADLKNTNTAIIGFGKEGQSILKYLATNQVEVTVFDKLDLNDLQQSARDLLAQTKARYVSGDDYLSQALDCHIWFKSPGVLLPKDIVQNITSHDIRLTSQTAWFFEHCPAKIIGITGTKGKGTTSKLISEILTAAGFNNYLTGNIGLQSAFDVLQKVTSRDLVVFELSSFQLEFLKQSPAIGVCLMVTNDHLDYHESQQQYWSAKAPIAKYQLTNDVLFFNADYEGSLEIGSLGKGKKFAISKTNPDADIYINESAESLTINLQNKQTQLPVKNRKLLGKHNLENIAAAAGIATYLNISPKIISDAVANFEGLPHRLQVIGKFNGVTYIDDSIATNPDTTIAALNGVPGPIVLILGGADKKLDYSQLLSYLTSSPKLKKIVLVGEVGHHLWAQLKKSNLQSNILGPHTNFQSAMDDVFKVVDKNDSVLLSPGATSFDMFANYAERGDVFSELVKKYYEQE